MKEYTLIKTIYYLMILNIIFWIVLLLDGIVSGAEGKIIADTFKYNISNINMLSIVVTIISFFIVAYYYKKDFFDLIK